MNSANVIDMHAATDEIVHILNSSSCNCSRNCSSGTLGFKPRAIRKTFGVEVRDQLLLDATTILEMITMLPIAVVEFRYLHRCLTVGVAIALARTNFRTTKVRFPQLKQGAPSNKMDSHLPHLRRT